MKLQIGKFLITVTEVTFNDVLKLSLSIDYFSKDVNAAVYVSFEQGANNPLVVKGEIKTGDIDHAK